MAQSAQPAVGPRFAWLAFLLVLAMLGVTGWALFRGKSWIAVPMPILLEVGNVAIRTLDEGGLWRLVAAKFQFGSIITLGLILPFFWIVASTFERIYGHVALLVAFFSATIVSSLCTLVFRDPFGVSTGAGGPTLTLAACLVVLAIRGASPAFNLERRRFWIRAGLTFVLYLVLIVPGIIAGTADYGSLGGGVAFGIVLGLVLVPVDVASPGRRTGAVGAAVALAATASVAAYLSIPEPPYLYSEAQKVTRAATAFMDQANKLNDTFEAMVTPVLDQDNDPRELAPRIEADLVAQWGKVARQFDGLPDKPAIPDVAYIQPMRAYAENRGAFLRLTAEGWKTGDEAQFIQAAVHKKKQDEAWVAMNKISAAVEAKKAEKKK